MKLISLISSLQVLFFSSVVLGQNDEAFPTAIPETMPEEMVETMPEEMVETMAEEIREKLQAIVPETDFTAQIEGDYVNKVDESMHSIESSGILWSSFAANYATKDDQSHECLRTCDSTTVNKKCHYVFVAEWYISLSKACYDCPFNMTDCQRPHCIPTDGHGKPIVVVNRALPGPSIQVCEGDEIIVDVVNELGSDTTSIHWHGLHQMGTPYMDGVPMLTQCPISPGTTFRYHFLAGLPGTHYWHSHSGFQRADGMFGFLVVRAKSDDHAALYDVDDPSHHVIITDWMETLTVDKFVNHHHSLHQNKPYNILVNGLGKFKPKEQNGKKAHTPLYEYRVEKGLRYRFRSVSNSIQNCPIIISVDNHNLTVIATDGNDMEPLIVESLVIYGGERWDFVVEANQPVGVYWMKFQGLLDCDDRFKSAHQLAIIRYNGATGFPEAPEDVNYNSTRREGLQLNKLNTAPGDLTTFYTAADVRSLPKYNTDKYKGKPDHKFWLDFDFYSRDNDLFHNEDFYPFFGVEKKVRLYMPQINNISLKLPNVPPLSQPDDLDHSLLCNSSSTTDCSSTFCHCTHVLNVERGSLVELILVDTGIVYWANHPFHLHGHEFAVLGMDRLGEETTLNKIKDLEDQGKLLRNFENPVIKDTVTIPDGGYTIVRFVADNPGYWLFHCHITFHVEVGMALVFHVGEQADVPPVPPKFPTCGSWVPKITSDLNDEVESWLQGESKSTGTTDPQKSSADSSVNSIHPMMILAISAYLGDLNYLEYMDYLEYIDNLF